MFKKIEDFLLKKFLGKILARLAITVAGYLAAGNLPGGQTLNLNPGELEAVLIALSHAIFEGFKSWRAKSEAPKTESAPQQ